MKPKITQDLKKYEELSVPYESEEAADAALIKFNEGLSRLRDECRISDVLVMAAVHVKSQQDGKTAIFNAPMAFGNSLHAPELAARLFSFFAGHVLDHAERLMSIIKGKQMQDESK